MGQVAQKQVLTAEEFVAWESEQVERHVFHEQDDGRWVLNPFAAPEPVHLASVNLTISAEVLFAEVDFR
jgi:hypothetical protein